MALNTSKVYSAYAIKDVKDANAIAAEARKNGSEDSNIRVAILQEEEAKLAKAVDVIVNGGLS